jgi:hypothetical protein
LNNWTFYQAIFFILNKLNPDRNKADRDQRDAMAARGYYQAFQKVKVSIKAVLNRKNSGEVAKIHILTIGGVSPLESSPYSMALPKWRIKTLGAICRKGV